jgi:hypothetical protein
MTSDMPPMESISYTEKEHARRSGYSRMEEAIWPHGTAPAMDQAQASYAHSQYDTCVFPLRTSLTFSRPAGKRLKGFARA